MTAAGATPHDRQSVVRAYSIANMAGWVQPISWMGGSPSMFSQRTALSVRSFASGPNSASQWSMASRNTGDV